MRRTEVVFADRIILWHQDEVNGLNRGMCGAREVTQPSARPLQQVLVGSEST